MTSENGGAGTAGSDKAPLVKRRSSRSEQLKEGAVNIKKKMSKGAWKRKINKAVAKDRVLRAMVEPSVEKEPIKILLEDHHHEHFRHVIHPYSKFRRGWDIVTVLAVMYLCWKIPFSISFDWYVNSTAVKYFEFFLDIWFGVDIVLNFRTGFIHNGHCVMNPKEIAKHYLEFWFWVDILASIPFEVFGGFITSKSARKSIKMVKWFKIPRLMRLGRLMKFLRHHARFYGVIVSSIGFLVACHICGCMFVAEWSPCGALPDDFVTQGRCSQDHVFLFYWQALHFGTSMMLGQSVKPLFIHEGMGDDFTAALHRLEGVWMVIGILYLAVFFGNIAKILANTNSQFIDFRSKLERIRHEMVTFGLPTGLQYRINRYYDYCWLNHHFGELSILHDKSLSHGIRRDVAMFMYRDVISKVPFLQDASSEVLATMCLNLKLQIYMPDDYVFHRGEIGRDLFLINVGTVSVLATDEKQELAQLSAGSFFGEMALMQERGKRNSSIMAITVCEMNSLNQETFHQIRADFPTFDVKMRELIKERQEHARQAGFMEDDVDLDDPATTQAISKMSHAGKHRLAMLQERVEGRVMEKLAVTEARINTRIAAIQAQLEDVIASYSHASRRATRGRN